jgi:hypothetical protein
MREYYIQIENFLNFPLWKVVFILFVLVLLTWGISLVIPRGVDWSTAFRPAALALLKGESPYTVYGFYNAPWTLIPLIPLAILPEQIGRAALFVTSVISLTFIAWKLGGNKLTILLLLLSPPALHGFLNGNIDWLAMYGFILPPQIGLFFIAIKPQVGVAVAVYWLWRTWQEGGWQAVLRTFLPFLVILMITFILFGLWPLRYQREIALWWNASLWPLSLPVGLALLIASIKKDRLEYAIGASPCLSPYVLFHSWIGALLAIIKSTPETIAAFVGLWALIILRAIQLY